LLGVRARVGSLQLPGPGSIQLAAGQRQRHFNQSGPDGQSFCVTETSELLSRNDGPAKTTTSASSRPQLTFLWRTDVHLKAIGLDCTTSEHQAMVDAVLLNQFHVTPCVTVGGHSRLQRLFFSPLPTIFQFELIPGSWREMPTVFSTPKPNEYRHHCPLCTMM